MDQQEAKKEYDELSLKYKDLSFREALYRVALGLTNYTISIIDINKHTIEEMHYEREWAGVSSVMENAPDSILKLKIIDPNYEDEYRKLFEEVYSGRESGKHTIRVVDKDGRWDWLTIYYKTLFDENNHPSKAVCFSEDITRKKEAENMYNQFMDIVESESQWSWRINLTKNIVTDVKSRIKSELDNRDYGLFSKLHNDAMELVLPEYRKELGSLFDRDNLIRGFSKGQRIVTLEYRMQFPETNEVLWLEGTMYLMLNTDEEICGILALKNIDQKKKKEIDIITKAQYDQMVHVLKRDSFMECVYEEMTKHNPITMFMIDVDSFKDVNDEYGHLFGDDVLKLVAETIKENFRKDDYVGRYGGDEFVVALCGDIDKKNIERLTVNLENKVSEIKFENGFKPALSIGVSRWDKKESLESLIDRADKALYQVKRAGKNGYNIEGD